jgi:hypothetical protein
MKQGIIFCLAGLLLFAACQPSQAAIEAAIAKTQTAQPTTTSTPTATPQPSSTPTTIPPIQTSIPLPPLKTLLITIDDFSTLSDYYEKTPIETTKGLNITNSLEKYSAVFVSSSGKDFLVLIQLFKMADVTTSLAACKQIHDSYLSTGQNLTMPTEFNIPSNGWVIDDNSGFVLLGFSQGSVFVLIQNKNTPGCFCQSKNRPL